MFSVNVDSFTEILVLEDMNGAAGLTETKTGWRIKENLKKVKMPLIKLIDLEPSVLH